MHRGVRSKAGARRTGFTWTPCLMCGFMTLAQRQKESIVRKAQMSLSYVYLVLTNENKKYKNITVFFIICSILKNVKFSFPAKKKH